jgi:hypothetical protein
MILCFGMVFKSSTGLAIAEYPKKEKKGCVTCHVTATSKGLNATGKY